MLDVNQSLVLPMESIVERSISSASDKRSGLLTAIPVYSSNFLTGHEKIVQRKDGEGTSSTRNICGLMPNIAREETRKSIDQELKSLDQLQGFLIFYSV